MEMLRRMADSMYGQDDPTRIYFQGQAHTIQPLDGGYELSVALPFSEKGEISLLRTGDELVLQVGAYRRSIILPRALVGLTTQRAWFENGHLKIRFVNSQERQ
jgi:arsenite-transporting ATPase